MDSPETTSLPANAYKPLAPGEVYRPLVPSSSSPPEVTARSVGWGLFLCAIFTVATCMYLPAYRAGTKEVARLRRAHPPATVLPVLYGCRGLVDVVTARQVLAKA